MLADGIRLMAIGMVTVFGFLTVLVALMAAQAAFFRAFSGRFADEASGEAPPADDDEVALAIAIAHARRLGRGASA
ncbi:MAG: OadG family protein [bacterium]|nr:OadG family protein [bacterium]